MTYMGPMGPIPPGTPAWHAADAANAAGGAYVIRLWAASGHGAIAYSPSTGRSGMSWAYSSEAEAEQRALSFVSAPDALVWHGHHIFMALARGTDGSYGVGWDSNPDAARARAIGTCRGYGGTGIHVETVIDTNRGLV
jgi:hypothetical protein